MLKKLIDLSVRPAKSLLPSIQRESIAAPGAYDGRIRAGPKCSANDGFGWDVNRFDPGDTGRREGRL